MRVQYTNIIVASTRKKEDKNNECVNKKSTKNQL